MTEGQAETKRGKLTKICNWFERNNTLILIFFVFVLYAIVTLRGYLPYPSKIHEALKVMTGCWFALLTLGGFFIRDRSWRHEKLMYDYFRDTVNFLMPLRAALKGESNFSDNMFHRRNELHKWFDNNSSYENQGQKSLNLLKDVEVKRISGLPEIKIQAKKEGFYEDFQPKASTHDRTGQEHVEEFVTWCLIHAGNSFNEFATREKRQADIVAALNPFLGWGGLLALSFIGLILLLPKIPSIASYLTFIGLMFFAVFLFLEFFWKGFADDSHINADYEIVASNKS